MTTLTPIQRARKKYKEKKKLEAQKLAEIECEKDSGESTKSGNLSKEIGGRIEGYISPLSPEISPPIPLAKSNRDLPKFAEKLFLLIMCISIILFLCDIEAQALQNLGMPKADSWAISIISELLLGYLSISLRTSLFARIAWCAIFTFTLGTVTWNVLKDHDEKVSLIESKRKFSENSEYETNTRNDRRDEIFASAKISFDIATKNGNLRIAQNMLKVMADLGEKKPDELAKIEVKESRELYDYQAIWLIYLRALLMLVNTGLIDRFFRRSQPSPEP